MTAHEVFKTLQALFKKKATATTIVLNTQENDTMQVAACTSNRVSNRSGRKWDNLLGNGMCRKHECRTMDQGRVGRKRQVGVEKGKKPCGRVKEGAAAASELGMETTDQRADGIGLVTLASSPLPRDDTVALTETPPVESEPPQHELETTQPIQTLHNTGSSREGQGVAMSHKEAVGDEVEVGEVDGQT